MTIHFIGAGPGAPDLITLRAKALIETSPVCLYAGSLVPEAVLNWCPKDTRIINTAPMDLDGIIAECVDAHEKGLQVARLHSGDLSLWSAIGEQMSRLDALGIPYSVTPGVPSFAAASAALKRELTQPEIAQTVVLTRTPGRASAMPAGEDLETYAKTGATLALHLSISALSDVVKTTLPHYGADCPVAVLYRVSWPDERILQGTLSTIEAAVAGTTITRTALILIGPALGAPHTTESQLYNASYVRRYRAGWTGGE